MNIFLSYSSKDIQLVNNLDFELQKYGATIYKDTRNLKALQDIHTFMSSIKEMDYAIILISSYYLKSKNCIFELSEFLKKEDSKKKIIPILLESIGFENHFYSQMLDHIKNDSLINHDKTFSFVKFIGSKAKLKRTTRRNFRVCFSQIS
jgi:TIR domain